MTDTQAKKEPTPEQKNQRQTVRIVARSMARLESKAGAEGKVTPDAVKAFWTENQKEYTATARKLVKDLARNGISLSYDETVAKARKGGKKAGAAGA